jgi:parallel beta-helix repeat protein
MKKTILTGAVLMLFLLTSCVSKASSEELARVGADLATAQTEILFLRSALSKLQQENQKQEASQSAIEMEIKSLQAATEKPVRQMVEPEASRWAAANVIVAANTTTASGKAQADFVCYGIEDQVEIQSAIDSLPPGGARVQLLEGTFFTGGSIILGDNVTLAGLGVGTILKFGDNHGRGGDFFLVKNSNSYNGNEGITIQDITFDGNKENQTMGYQHGVGLTRASEARITGCVFRGFSGAGIFANRLHNSTVSGNTFEGNDCGINIEGIVSEGNSILNNLFLYNVTTGIRLADSVTNTIMGNTNEGDTATSWRLSGATYTTLFGNVSKKRAGYGLFMDGKSNYNTICANLSEGGAIGFAVSDCHHNSFQGNIATKAVNYGFGFDKRSSRNLVVGNTAEENGNEGIMFHTNCVYNVVSSNRCERNGHHGISFLYGSDYNTATGNNLLENGQATVGQYEIYIHKSSYNLISANSCNKIYGRDYDIYITDAESVGNIIVNNVGKLFNGGEKTRY